MNKATAAFISQHADADVRQLALQGTKDPEVDLLFALDQIAGRQTARHKLPTWAATEGIVYPPHLSMEQCSSEQTARYKQRLVQRLVNGGLTDSRLVDLTGGFGVDFSWMARSFSRAVYVERQEHLCNIAKENFRLLELTQAEVVCADSMDYLKSLTPIDIIYMDPARRDSHGSRTYALSDCTPDVLTLRDLLLQKARNVVLKLSPMLDWRKAVSDIGETCVSEVHIVSVNNECKELLLVLGQDCGNRLVCVNDDAVFEVEDGFGREYREREGCGIDRIDEFNGIKGYLYEPNASIMKAGCFAELSQRFAVAPVAANSHLFVSAGFVDNFPGRIFVIDAVTSLNKRELKQHLQGLTKANITVRNFPLTVAELRKRLKLSEGGITYLFATTLASGEHVLIVCHKP